MQALPRDGDTLTRAGDSAAPLVRPAPKRNSAFAKYLPPAPPGKGLEAPPGTRSTHPGDLEGKTAPCPKEAGKLSPYVFCLDGDVDALLLQDHYLQIVGEEAASIGSTQATELSAQEFGEEIFCVQTPCSSLSSQEPHHAARSSTQADLVDGVEEAPVSDQRRLPEGPGSPYEATEGKPFDIKAYFASESWNQICSSMGGTDGALSVVEPSAQNIARPGLPKPSRMIARRQRLIERI